MRKSHWGGPIGVAVCVVLGLLGGIVCAETAQLTPNWQAPLGPITNRYFGYNTVWSKGGLGIWDDADHTYYDAIVSRIVDLHPGVLRFPGGTRAMRYRFEETIGPYALRKPQCDTFTATYDATTYGMDEFLRLAESMGVEVSFVSPWAQGSPQRTAAMVAYANASPDSNVVLGVDLYGQDWKTAGYWAGLRAANGHPAPYGVKYLEIGNEQYFAIPVGLKDSCDWSFPYRQNFRLVDGKPFNTTALDLSDQVEATGQLVREVDPQIQIGAVAHSRYKATPDVTTFRSPVDRVAGNQDPWNVRLVERAGDAFDFFILHPHRFGYGHHALYFADHVDTAIHAFRELDPTKKIAITEYGFFFRGHSMLNALYTADMIRVAAADQIMMALKHDLIEDGSTAWFGTSGVLQSTGAENSGYAVMKLLSQYFQGTAVSTVSSSRELSGLGAISRDGNSLSILLLNRSLADDVPLDTSVALPGGAWSGTLYSIAAPTLGSNVLQSTSTPVFGGSSVQLSLKPHSVNVLVLGQGG